MNKFLYTSALCAFSLLLGSTASKAIDFPEHYRTLDIHQEYTKQTDNFTVKNVFPFKFPADLPGVPVFKGIKGQLSTTTQASFDENGKENTYSETLFNIAFVKNACPKAGDGILSMDSAYGAGNHLSLTGGIVKQTKGNATQVYNIDFMNQYDTVLDTRNGGCGVVYFDGTDFKKKPYTMLADLQLKYSFQPIGIPLDGEFILDVDTYAAKARYNAYIVYPVAKGAGPGQGVIRPGTIFSVNGDATASGSYVNNKGDWSVRYVTAVVKNNSCQVGFKNYTQGQDLSKRFQTQDQAGVGSAPNPTAVLWPTSTIISDFTLVGNGRDSVVGNVRPNQNLPVHVNDGDCVVQAMLPLGKITTTPGTNVNVESQTNIQYIPD
ncbi:unnamed protein product [Commensalibacter communis]|uniref:Uncharacterized protein n=1 Tax=Commensalibacter communis TaxID=2972786 RepID=A0A9W4TMV1_9PROT|nr:hypothetical protein [Commensalibacter communis]CAI3948276.1 unnamed protein product [Commensalibacter communis]CAI3951471.1 unnamed protein product [Commensalibacter communis]CAI3951525.1 unnamed protein product [Commensalibacter communis]CAI3952604.1 unnamed protein product [Commensalibacter communis]CAI3953184.1 unnamed protein product [Commensalibacter communis]